MSKNGNPKRQTADPVSDISKIVGAAAPLLPGDSLPDYQDGLLATLKELNAQTPLQAYLAEKIFDCLWWIRCYERNKRHSVIGCMADILLKSVPSEELRTSIFMLMSAHKWDDPTIKGLLEKSSLTRHTLLNKAMSQCSSELFAFDEQIALRVKTLQSLQASYEALVNRSIVTERLKLQNELLKRDLDAIDVPRAKPVDRLSEE